MLQTAEQEKNKNYLEAVQTRHATFSPFVVSVDGVLGREANVFIKRLAEKIAYTWEKSLSEVTGWIGARMAFAILRATNLCLRGSRKKMEICMGLVWMMVQVYPLVKNHMCTIMYVSYVLSVCYKIIIIIIQCNLFVNVYVLYYYYYYYNTQRGGGKKKSYRHHPKNS